MSCGRLCRVAAEKPLVLAEKYATLDYAPRARSPRGRRKFRTACAARATSQPPDFFDGAMPLTYVPIRILNGPLYEVTPCWLSVQTDLDGEAQGNRCTDACLPGKTSVANRSGCALDDES